MIREMLSRLEVLTDLVEFAHERMALNSPLTAGWYNKAWPDIITNIRDSLPDDVVKEFDDERRRVKEFRRKLST